MRTLRAQQPMFMGEEEQYNLMEGLVDIRYVRDLMHLIGSEERARFDECSWDYGDPTYLGGDAMEVFEGQLSTVLYTLFGGERFADAHNEPPRANIHFAYVAMDEDDLTGDLVRVGGGEVRPQCIDRISPPTIAEHLHPVRRPSSGPGVGIAHAGVAKLNAQGYTISSQAVSEVEDIVAAEIRGEREAIADLEELLYRGCGEGQPPLLYRWRTGSAGAGMLAEDEDSVLMLCGEELYGVRAFFHDAIFAWLLAAWREL